MIPRTAGTTTTATMIDIKTTTAVAIPMVVIKGMSTTMSPRSAMITVNPAKITALPAVPFAIAIDS
ncbi:hypothetical protein D3C81_2286420 [compost metagenome]